MSDKNSIAINEKRNRRKLFLPFALPDIDETEFLEVKEALESGWVTTGPKVKQFEREFAEEAGFRHAVAVNSCTAAMHLALEAIGLQRGDEVITSPYTFAATAEVIRYFDAKPVFVDVDPLTLNLNLNLIESAISPRTRAIIPVHIAGLPVDMNALHVIAGKHGIAVVEDAAHMDGHVYGQWLKSRQSPVNQQPLTNNRHASTAVCFSFYATKTITTGEGGMICTDDDAVADRCRIMALHGISRDAWKRYTAEGNWYYEITAPGYKYNMTDVAAAMGLAQLRKCERMLVRRREIAEAYNRAFAAVPALQLPVAGLYHSWHLYMLRLNRGDGRRKSEGPRSSVPGQRRAELIEALKARNIGTSVHFIPLHIHPYYKELYGYKPEDFPVAYNEYLREVSLPIYSKMTDEDVQDVIDAVLDLVAG